MPEVRKNLTTGNIQNIASSANLENVEIEYTQNGEYTLSPSEGFDGIAEAKITVDIDTETPYNEGYADGVSDQKERLTSLNVSANGTYTNADGYDEVNVNVQPNLQSKTIDPSTSQQTVTPDQNYDGLSQVTVSGVTASIDQNITASNIKDGVTILGVTGTYDPQPSLESKTASYTANGTYTITPSTGYDGINDVEVTVNVTSCPDWSSIGWDCNDVTASGIDADLAYTAQKKAEFEGGTITSFANDSKLVFAPNVNYPANSISFYASDHKLTFVPPIEYTGDNLVFYVDLMFDYCESLKYVDITLHNTISIDNLFSNCTTLKTATLRNTSTVTSAKQVFRNCNYLEEAPLFDTSNVTNMSGMFQGCSQMLTTIPQYNTASVTDMSYFLSGCGRLVNIPLLNTSNVTSFTNAFRGTSITSLPQLNTSEANDMSYAFNNCRSLTTIPQLDFGKVKNFIFMFTGCTALTTLGGFINLGKALNSAQQVFDLSASSVLTYQSIMNVINNLAAPDNTAITGTTLQLSAASYALLSADDIAIATAKNWTVTSA